MRYASSPTGPRVRSSGSGSSVSDRPGCTPIRFSSTQGLLLLPGLSIARQITAEICPETGRLSVVADGVVQRR